MGEHNVKKLQSDRSRAEFITHLLNDIRALEYMLEHDMIEKGITRIGAEQEFCLVTEDWRPAENNLAILEAIADDHFTTELAKYNLELNLDPHELTTGCFAKVEDELNNLLEKASKVAGEFGSKVILAGILPTIGSRHLAYNYITPNKRYYALNEMLKAVRGGDFQLHLRGVDELSIIHDTVLFEACNTSFQLHLQIDPDDFIQSYNWSQAISGPILAVSTNSPLLLGRELWAETRIALFQQSIDTRNTSYALKDQRPRVSFGKRWATGTVADIFKDNIAEYPIILSTHLEGNALEEVQQGQIPKLRALALHSGTIYPWNRACYGVGGGKPHLRIENRYIPSGPSTKDEMATFAFWVGLMKARPQRYDDLPNALDFKEVKNNFIKAARVGMDAILQWEGRRLSAQELVCKELVPMAAEGLRSVGISEESINNYLGVIEQRCRGFTGTKWQIRNYRNLGRTMKNDQALRQITAQLHHHQQSGKPVAEWDDIQPGDKVFPPSNCVGHIMSSQLFTVHQDDLAQLAIDIMEWKNIHHVPVTDERGELSGLLTWSHVMKHQAASKLHPELTVGEIMETHVIRTTPETRISKAIEVMKDKEIGCLPVVQRGDLVGIVTIKDLLPYDDN